MGPQSKDRGKTSPAVMCIKILLHIFNFLYTVIGVCVLAVGIAVQVQLKNYLELTQLYYENTAYIMIAIGVLILLVALAGFYCTAKDKIALLYMYGVFISLLAIVQIGAGIAGGAKSQSLDDKVTEGLSKTIHDPSLRKYWDDVQQKLHCCGVETPKDWGNSLPSSCYPNNVVPPSPPAPSNTTASPANTTTTSTTTTEDTNTTTTSTTTTTAPTTSNITSNTTTATNATTSTTTTTTTTTTNSTTPTTTPTSNNSTAPTSNNSTAPTNTTTTTTTTTTPTTTTPKSGGRKKRNANNVYDTGCHKKIKSEIQQYLSVIVGVCVGFVVLQVLGAVLACCLARRTSRNNYEQIY